MCTIDALMMFKYVKPRLDDVRTATLTFAAILAKQLLDNTWDCESEEASHATRRRRLRVCRGTQKCGSERRAHLLGLRYMQWMYRAL
jgi:hypothetical protein